MDLKEYDRVKFDLAAIMRSAWLGVEGAKPEVTKVSHEFFARLAEDRFNLVVAGRFNRGKTSLMNALLQTTRLPVGVVPLTSVITTVSYGSEERAEIVYRNRQLPDRIALDALADYVTTRGNPENARGVETARVQLPAKMLRSGFHFIDTPGLGSSFVENTRLTEDFLPEADAVLLVTSYDSPLTEEELRTLEGAASSARRVFLVVNKQDTVSPKERAEVERYIDERLAAVFASNAPQLYSVSARQALLANETADRALWSESGLCLLEEELTRFLVEEKQSEFLRQMCERAMQALDVLPSADNEREQLRGLRLRLAGNGSGSASATPHSAMPQAPEVRTAAFTSCAVCAGIEEAIYTYLCRYQYDLIATERARKNLAQRGGLCAFHMWQYETIATPRGTCIGFVELIDTLAMRLRDIAFEKGRDPASELAGFQPNPEQCDVCAVRAEAERAAIRNAARTLTELPINGSPGCLCLPHLRQIATCTNDRSRVVELLELEAQALERTAEDMHRYVLKFDGMRRFLFTSEEESAAQRALTLLAGRRNLSVTRKR